MNIHELAKQAGQRDYWLERFAALVEAAARADEREECAKACDDEADDGTEGEWDTCCHSLARKIRERGTT